MPVHVCAIVSTCNQSDHADAADAAMESEAHRLLVSSAVATSDEQHHAVLPRDAAAQAAQAAQAAAECSLFDSMPPEVRQILQPGYVPPATEAAQAAAGGSGAAGSMGVGCGWPFLEKERRMRASTAVTEVRTQKGQSLHVPMDWQSWNRMHWV